MLNKGIESYESISTKTNMSYLPFNAFKFNLKVKKKTFKIVNVCHLLAHCLPFLTKLNE